MRKIIAALAAIMVMLLPASLPQTATAIDYPDYRFTACNTHDDAGGGKDAVCVYGVASRQADGTGIIVHSGGFYGYGPNSNNVCDDLYNAGWDDNPPIVNKDLSPFSVTAKASGEIWFSDNRDATSMPSCDRVYPAISAPTLSAARIAVGYTARLHLHGDPSNRLYVDIVYSQGSWTIGCGNLDNGSAAERCFSNAPGA